jgi:hypothetical protein
MAIPFISGPKIVAGQSLSDVLDCSAAPPVRISMPAAWTPAHLTFQLSSDGIVFENLLDASGKEIRVNVVPGSVVRLGSQFVTAAVFLKFRSGSAGVPIVQAADRIFGCAMDNQSLGSPGPAGPQGPAGPAGPAGPSAVSANAGNLAKLGTDSLILVPNTLALKGTVAGDDAAAGNVGEFLAASNTTGVQLTTAVTANIVSLNLPAGDWMVAGIVIFTPAGTGPNSVLAGISTISAMLPTDNQVLAGGTTMFQAWSGALTASKPQTLPVGMCRINITAPSVVYLVAQASFGGGSVTVTGRITARRAR